MEYGVLFSGLFLLLLTVALHRSIKSIFEQRGYPISDMDHWTSLPAQIAGFWVSILFSTMTAAAISLTFVGLLRLGGF